VAVLAQRIRSVRPLLVARLSVRRGTGRCSWHGHQVGFAAHARNGGSECLAGGRPTASGHHGRVGEAEANPSGRANLGR